MYVTLEKMLTWIDYESDPKDIVQDGLDETVDFINGFTHRIFEVPSDTTLAFDPRESVDGKTLFFTDDLLSVTTAEVDGVEIPADQYILKPLNSPRFGEIVLRRDSASTWTTGTDIDSIQITGKWGFSLVASLEIQKAVKLITADYVKAREAAGQGQRGDIFSATGLILKAATIPPDALVILKRVRKKQ